MQPRISKCYKILGRLGVPMWPMYGLCAPFSSTIGHDNGLAGVIGGLAQAVELPNGGCNRE